MFSRRIRTGYKKVIRFIKTGYIETLAVRYGLLSAPVVRSMSKNLPLSCAAVVVTFNLSSCVICCFLTALNNCTTPLYDKKNPRLESRTEGCKNYQKMQNCTTKVLNTNKKVFKYNSESNNIKYRKY